MKKGWEVKNLEKCINKTTYANKIQRKNFLEKGNYPIVSQEKEIINGYWDNPKDLFKIKEPVIAFGDHTRIIKYIDFDFVLGADGVKVLQPNEVINSKYLYYYLKNIDLGNLGYARHYRILKEKNIYFPTSIEEQKRIVAILDKAFAAIDKAKENAQKNLKNAKELFESYLQEVFENKGSDWEEKTIQKVAKVINGFAFASKDFNPTNTVKSIKITNVGVKEFVEEMNNYLPEKFKETLKEVKVKEGNIVIALTRTIIAAGLKVAVIPASYDGALLNQRVAAIATDGNVINQRYLYNFLITDVVKKYVLNHVNILMQPNLSINDLKNLLVPCPSLKKQNEIVQKLDQLQEKTKALETIYQQKLANLEELKKSILQKAFNGELSNNANLV